MSTSEVSQRPVILAADTSSRINTVAVTRGTQLLAEVCVDAHRLHAERLIDTVEWVLREADIALEMIDLLAVAAGPGSFTGLRIGVSTWKGLAFGLKKPLLGVSTLDALARQVTVEQGVICPLLDARMKEVFGAAFISRDGELKKIHDDWAGPVEALLEALPPELGQVYVFGEGAEAYRARIEAACDRVTLLAAPHGYPRASFVAAEALHLLEGGAIADGALLSPVYLRQSQAEQNRARVAEARVG